MAKNDLDDKVLSGIKHQENTNYLALGWGDKNFYLNTPTWGDLTFKTAMGALFLNSPTLVHVTQYQNQQTDWVEVKVSKQELEKLNAYLLQTFALNENGEKILLENKGYGSNDDFYKAKGNYSCFNTCNTWVNSGFKTSGLKSCYWTPFDFGLIDKYQ